MHKFSGLLLLSLSGSNIMWNLQNTYFSKKSSCNFRQIIENCITLHDAHENEDVKNQALFELQMKTTGKFYSPCIAAVLLLSLCYPLARLMSSPLTNQAPLGRQTFTDFWDEFTLQ